MIFLIKAPATGLATQTQGLNKTSHFITECYVRKNATVKELPPGLNPVAPTYCIYVPQAKENDSVELAKLIEKNQLLLLFE